MASLAVSTPIVQTFEAGKFPALAGAARPDRARSVHAFDRVDVPADARITKTIDFLRVMAA
jgi:hypothetical protein